MDMKIYKRMIVFSFVLVACLSGVSFLNVSAQNASISEQQTEQIRSSCASTKNTLNQLHASDALLRVNRGQVYESILTKLLDKFNNRVSSNKMSSSGLESVTSEYNVALNIFRQDYKAYEEHLSAAIDIDCSKKPADFYDAILLARAERDRVHTSVVRLNQLIDKYQLSLTQFENDYKAAIKEINK